jgi:GT2 family glycosyltransferase
LNFVSIITVNFNHSHVTEAFLEAFYRTNNYLQFEIIVVDNGSLINPIPEWEVKYPSIQFIRSEINLGFAAGNNLGIAKGKGDYFFLVNNDTEFTPGLIQSLVDTLEANPKTAMVSPKIRYFQDKSILQYAGYSEMNYYTARNNCIGQFEKDLGQYDTGSQITGFGHGAAMMVTKMAIESVGLMRENYFLYFEELDWAARMKKQGFDIRINLHALIYHKESISVGANSALKAYFMNRNRILFIRQNATIVQLVFFYFHFVFLVIPRNIFTYVKNGNANFIFVLFRAFIWNLTHAKNSQDLGFKL